MVKRTSFLTTALLVVALAVSACGQSGPNVVGPITAPSTQAPVATTTPPSTSIPPPTTSITSTTTSTTPGTPTTTAPATTPPSTAAPGSGASSSTITVYFLQDEGAAVPVPRQVTTREVARAAIEALVAGPTSSESAQGLSTAVPAGTLVLGLRIDAGTAIVDLSREFESGGGSFSVIGRLAQVVYSLTEFSSVDRVQFRIDGRQVDVFSNEGLILSPTVTRADFTSAFPIGVAPGGDPIATWDQSQLPAVTPGAPDVFRVVLVAGDDILNVRDAAGTGGRIIGRLQPGVAVKTAGGSTRVGSSTWVTVATPAGPGWVNSFYLTRSIGDQFPGGADPLRVVRDLADRMARGDDLSPIVSEKGLWVVHHAAPLRFPRTQVDGLLADRTTYRWGSNALEPNSPEIRPRTFSQAVAERVVGAYHDADSRVLFNEIVEGPNGRPAAHAIPTELAGFPFVTIHDPGDDPQYGGLDWTIWIVSLAYENGQIRVVGLTLDEWSP